MAGKTGGKTARRQRGEGALYQRANGLWVGVLELRSGDGTRRRKIVTSMKYADAQRKLREAKRALAEHGDLPTSTITVTKWLDYWLEHVVIPHVRPNTAEQYASDVRLHISPEIGRIRLDRLDPHHVLNMDRAIIAKGRSSTTALRCHRVLSKALKDAVAMGKVTHNVATHAKAPRKAVNSRGALTAEQGRTLLTSVSADGWQHARWAASLSTGARQGEVLGLEWNRIAFDTGLIDFSWQLQRLPHQHGCGQQPCGRQRPGNCPDGKPAIPDGFELRHLRGGLYLTRPKTNSSYRVVPMTHLLADALLALWQQSGKPSVGLVFTTKGEPIDPAVDSAAWKAALLAAGLPEMPLHSARHTAASIYLDRRIDARVIADLLGHSSIVTTRGYQHATTALTLAAVNEMDLALTSG